MFKQGGEKGGRNGNNRGGTKVKGSGFSLILIRSHTKGGMKESLKSGKEQQRGGWKLFSGPPFPRN